MSFTFHRVGPGKGDVRRAFLYVAYREILTREHLAHTRRAAPLINALRFAPHSETRLSGMVFPSSNQNGRARSSMRFCAYAHGKIQPAMIVRDTINDNFLSQQARIMRFIVP